MFNILSPSTLTNLFRYCSMIYLLVLLCNHFVISSSETPLQLIGHTVISGVPFQIQLPKSAKNQSILPECMRLMMEDGTSSLTILEGLCLHCEIHSENWTASKLEKDPIHVIRFHHKPQRNRTELLLLNIRVVTGQSMSPWKANSPISVSNNIGPKCQKQMPTIALLSFRGSLCQNSLSNRFLIWNSLLNTLKTVSRDHSMEYIPWMDKRVLMASPFVIDGYQLLTNPNEARSQLQFLARAPKTKEKTGSMRTESDSSSAVWWSIGCGAIESLALQQLSEMEQRLEVEPIVIPIMGASIDLKRENISITQWYVGDMIKLNSDPKSQNLPEKHSTSNLVNSSQLRHPRSAMEAAPIDAFQEEEQQGSGLIHAYRYSGIVPAERYAPIHPYQTRPTEKGLKTITPVKIIVHQITNVQIPSDTFQIGSEPLRDFEAQLHQPLSTVNLTAEEIRSSQTELQRFGPLVTRDPKEWISFDASNRIVRLRPTPEHVGNHQLVLCAILTTGQRYCEPFLVSVRRPAPFRKNFILRIPPGIFWCYRVPIYWFEELKVKTFEHLELTVNGDAPFSWDAQLTEVCVVTMLRVEQVITLFFYASNSQIAQSVEIEFRLSARAPPPQRLITQSRLRLRLQWPEQLKSYQLQELNRVNASLAQALRVRVNSEVTAANLFIYDIIQFFTSANDSSPAVLELEWIFLPHGLPNQQDNEWTSLPGNSGKMDKIPRISTVSGQQTGFLEHPNSLSLSLTELLKHCKSANLDGAEVALKATEESFRPFTLKSVQLIPLEQSACHMAKRFTDKSRTSGQLGNFNPTGEREAGGKKPFDWLDGAIDFPATFQMKPEVITNFTVTAGVSFKKLINPAAATPLERIQFMELVDANALKLDDTAWIVLHRDNTHLFGLALKHHIRARAYVFGLQLYSVDRKTPITIGFTIEVQDWFGTGSAVPAQEQIIPNHRVRLRIQPNFPSGNWATEPVNSLDYRWHLSTAIDKFLRPNCPPPCNPDVGIWDLNRHDGNAIFVVWAQLSLLMENNNGNKHDDVATTVAESTNSALINGNCPWERINRFQSLLTFAPSVVSVEKNMGLVTGYSPNREIFLSPWSAPSVAFRNQIATAGLGSVEAAVVDRMGSCAKPAGQDVQETTRSSQTSVDHRYAGPGTSWNTTDADKVTFTIFTGEAFRHKLPQTEQLKTSGNQLHLYDIMGQKVGSSNWIGLEIDQSTIYGIVIGIAVQPITYRFKISTRPTDSKSIQFAIYVAGSNPQMPRDPNHRIVMRFGPEPGQQWSGGHSLLDRWRLVAALDTFLRPHCMANSNCLSDMDILLMTFNFQVHGFTVIWAQKSLLIKQPGSHNVGEKLNSLEQKQHWDKWLKERKQWVVKSTLLRAKRFTNQPISSTSRGCPRRELIQLEQRLLGDSGYGLLPLPELAQHLKASGVGSLKEVQVERLGPCADIHGGLPFYVPEPSIVNQRGIPVPDSYRPVRSDLPVVTSHQPTTPRTERQRVILLGTLLPICLGVILLLLGVLAFVWYRKRDKGNNQGRGAASGERTMTASAAGSTGACGGKMPQIHTMTNPVAERVMKLCGKTGRHTDVPMAERDNGIHPSGNGTGMPNRPPIIPIHPDGLDDQSSPVTKPLLLTNDRPPLKPPEYNMAYTDSPVNTMPHFPVNMAPMHAGVDSQMIGASGGLRGVGGVAVVAAAATGPACVGSSSVICPTATGTLPKPFYGIRPNPYRNLPPPIETRPGMPSPASQLPYAPYRPRPQQQQQHQHQQQQHQQQHPG